MNFRTLLIQAERNGGATYHPANGQPFDGYIVSTFKDRERKIPQLDESELRKYFLNNIDLFTLNYYLGVWREGGEWYLDVVSHVNELSEALKLAKDNNQLAIFDVKNQKTIFV